MQQIVSLYGYQSLWTFIFVDYMTHNLPILEDSTNVKMFGILG